LWLKRQFGPRLCRRVNEKRLKQLLADCSSPILLNNNVGPSTKLFSDTDNPVWESTLDGNKAAPLMMIPGFSQKWLSANLIESKTLHQQ